MAHGATIFHIQANLSDIENHVYKELNLRVAQHPSESSTRLAARLIAYFGFYGSDTGNELQFTRGLDDSNEPALWRHSLSGELLEWVEVGLPSRERLHLASKRSPLVKLVCYKSSSLLEKEFSKKKIYRHAEVEVFFIEPSMCQKLGEAIERSSNWSVILNDGSLQISIDGNDFLLDWLPQKLPG